MAFESCEQVNTLFIQGQEHIERNLIKKKFVPANAYYGRMPSGSFPKNSGLTHRGHRLARQAPPDELNWRRVEQDVCNTNACDFDPDVIHNGSDSYNWSLVAMDLRTDWICLDSLVFNEFPEEEIDHMEMSLQNINRNVFEEFGRSRWTDNAENKIVGVIPTGGIPDPDTKCDNVSLNGGWIFERYANGEVNPNRVRVQLASDDAARISELTNDLLEQTVIRLQYEEAAYIADSVQLYDLVVPDLRTSLQLAKDEDEQGGFYKSLGGYQASDLDRELGVQRVVGNFAHRYDRYAMKFYPSATQPDAGAFDPADTATWLVLERVFPYRQEEAEIGVRHVVNEEYINAPFAITNAFIRDVVRIETLSKPSSYGSATKAMNVPDFTPDAKFIWKNPDWDCNVKRNKGFWLACYELAAHPRMTELGHSWLHRIDTRIHLIENPCATTSATCYDPVSPYCCDAVEGAEQCTGGENRVQGTRRTYS
jgi:hypothetical protein